VQWKESIDAEDDETGMAAEVESEHACAMACIDRS